MNDALSTALQRLSTAALDALPAAVQRPPYDRARAAIGIVHFGPGAFHRAHQAAYIDDVLADDPGWAICAVSLHSRSVRDALRPQDGLYTLALLDDMPAMRVIGAIREVLCAPEEPCTVLQRLAEASVRLVTLTITEKGYCLAGDDLDLQHPEIARDLATPYAPRTAIGYIVAGLRERYRTGTRPYTVLSCDNLADNGRRLRRAVLQYAQCIDAGLAEWISARVAFPCSMVDSITPASDDALRERVAAELGCVDAWPVQREPYAQWVVEDDFCNERPPFERCGVVLSDDIAGYDRAKLRLLNGAHSTLAYVGSLLGLDTVAAAMRHPDLAAAVERLMREDIAPTLAAPAGLDLQAYVDAILGRFRHRAVRHRLSQIAWDGSQKLPVRLLGTLADAQAAGRRLDRLCLPLAAWMHFVRRRLSEGVELVDPLHERLRTLAGRCRGDAQHDVDLFLELEPVFGSLHGDGPRVDALRAAYAALGDGSPEAVSRVLEALA